MLASTMPRPKGITAQATSESRKVSMGAKRKTVRLAPLGITVSLKKSLSPSAIGWRSPKGPTTLGPLRSCDGADHLALGIGDVGHHEEKRHDDRHDLERR